VPKERGQTLCFERPEGDPTVLDSPANSCDVFQLVDLRALRTKHQHGDAMLELSAEFLDARPQEGEPIQFSCHLYLFTGKPEALHSAWPSILRESVGFGVGESISYGGSASQDWRAVTARCVLSPDADFAVVQIGCGKARGKTMAPPKLGQQFADNISLVMKTQPRLPVRVVQH
jgi:hypothetical protein